MATNRTPGSSTRRALSYLAFGVGILLLLVMPVTLFVFSLAPGRGAHLPGTLVIVTSAGGMALLVIGAALRE